MERVRVNRYEKVMCNLEDKKEYVVHKKFKTNIRSWVNIKIVQRVTNLIRKLD